MRHPPPRNVPSAWPGPSAARDREVLARRRRGVVQMEEVPGADLSTGEIDIRLRRTCVYTDLPMENCHKCRSKLVRRYQSYMVLTRLGGPRTPSCSEGTSACFASAVRRWSWRWPKSRPCWRMPEQTGICL